MKMYSVAVVVCGLCLMSCVLCFAYSVALRKNLGCIYENKSR